MKNQINDFWLKNFLIKKKRSGIVSKTKRNFCKNNVSKFRFLWILLKIRAPKSVDLISINNISNEIISTEQNTIN